MTSQLADSAVDSGRSAARVSAKMLASGSNGNCLLVRAGATTLLVDCGIATRTLTGHLRDRGIAPESIDAILLTHEHNDHASGAGTFSRKYGTKVVADPRTLVAAGAAYGQMQPRPLAVGSTAAIGEAEVTSFPVAHDAAAPTGFIIQAHGWTIAYCVDLGTAAEALHPALALADLLILEANHDYDTLRTGPYSPSLKARILSPLGHLSNLEAARLISGSANGRARTIWLAHLSAVNNSPRLARRIVGGYLRRENVQGVRLEIAERGKPSLCWSTASVGWQLPLPV